MPKTQDIIQVDSPLVACSGEDGDHPLVYLAIGEEGYIDCPYCRRHFCLVDQDR
jgi:uncharacterized Zn-finger protein